MKNRIRKVSGVFGWSVGLALILQPVVGLAQVGSTENFITPDFRGDPDTAFDGWNGFFGGEAISPVGGPGGNIPNWPGSDGSAFLRQTASNAGALIIGSGNLYSFQGPLQFEIDQTLGFEAGMVALQIRTSGSLPDYDSVYLRYQEAGNEVFLKPTPVGGLERIDLLNREESFMDDTSYVRESLWHWDLTGINGISEYSILFAGEKAHLSLHAVTLDAASAYSPIPEPGTVSLLAGLFVGVGVIWIRRRKRFVGQKESSS